MDRRNFLSLGFIILPVGGVALIPVVNAAGPAVAPLVVVDDPGGEWIDLEISPLRAGQIHYGPGTYRTRPTCDGFTIERVA